SSCRAHGSRSSPPITCLSWRMFVWDDCETIRLPSPTAQASKAGHDVRSAFFFVLFFFGRAQASRRAERFALVEQRQITHVQQQHAARRLLVDNDSDRTAFDAFAEGNAA